MVLHFRHKSEGAINGAPNEVSYRKLYSHHGIQYFISLYYIIIHTVFAIGKLAAGIILSWYYSGRGKRVYEDPRYMTVEQASKQITEAIETRREQGSPLKRETNRQAYEKRMSLF